MGTDGTYRTSDLYVAAYLLSMGLELRDIDRRDRRRCDFVFVDREDRPGFVQTRVHREDKTLEDILGQPLQSLAPKSGQKQLAKEG